MGKGVFGIKCAKNKMVKQKIWCPNTIFRQNTICLFRHLLGAAVEASQAIFMLPPAAPFGARVAAPIGRFSLC